MRPWTTAPTALFAGLIDADGPRVLALPALFPDVLQPGLTAACSSSDRQVNSRSMMAWI